MRALEPIRCGKKRSELCAGTAGGPGPIFEGAATRVTGPARPSLDLHVSRLLSDVGLTQFQVSLLKSSRQHRCCHDPLHLNLGEKLKAKRHLAFWICVKTNEWSLQNKRKI